MIDELSLSKGDGRIFARSKSQASVELLILDDWGLEPLDGNARHNLLEIPETDMDGALPWSRASFPSRANSIIGDPTYADAIFDRLVHSANGLKLPGEFMRRLAQVAMA